MMYGLLDAFCSADVRTVRSNFLVDILGALPDQLLLDFFYPTIIGRGFSGFAREQDPAV